MDLQSRLDAAATKGKDLQSRLDAAAAKVAEVEQRPSSMLSDVGRGVDDLIRSLASGAFGNYADEFAAKMNEITGLGGSYEENLAAEAKRDKSIHPGLAIPGEIVGGVASTIAAAPLAAPLKAAAPFVTKMPGWLKAAGLGGFMGGLYGSGSAKPGDRLEGGAIGAGLGAGTGAALYPIAKGLQYGAGKLAGALGDRHDPYRASLRKLHQGMIDDELTPGRIRARLKNLGPQSTITDAGGENVMSVGRAAAGIPGAAKNRAAMVLNARSEGEGARIGKALNRKLSNKDFYAAEEGFLKDLRTKAAPLYRSAYERHQSIMTPRLKRMLQSKHMQRALNEAIEITDAEYASGQAKYLGAVDKELTDAARFAADIGKLDRSTLGNNSGVIRGFSLETWDQIKRGVDGILQGKSYSNELTGKLNHRGVAVDKLRRSLLAELDRATGGERSVYAQARKVYSGDAEVVGALRDGRKALRLDPEVIRAQLSELSDAGKDAYRTGAARAIKDVVDSVPDTASAANRIFNKSANRKRFREIFPDPDAFNEFARAMTSEQRFAQTKNMVLGGSQTAPRLAEGESRGLLSDLAGTIGAVGAAELPAGHALVMSRAGRQLGTSLFGSSGEMEKASSKMMFNRNQSINQKTLDDLMEYAARKDISTEQFAHLGQILLSIMAQQEGRAVGQNLGDK